MPTRWILPIVLALPLPAGARAEAARVACAISLKEAVTEVAAAFKAEGRGEVQFTFGSSGQLQAQIEYGAPLDAFISAAHEQVDQLVEAKRAEGASKHVVASNSLVLVVPASAQAAPTSLKALADARVKRVAVGEPKTVPAGRYAEQALHAAGVDETLKGRLVYGANVRQVLDYVERGEVDAGVVYATDARESRERVRVASRIDPRLHDPVEYPAVLILDSRRRKAAGAFLDYLGTEKARDILTSHGFTTPARQSQRPRE
jgi:molybdate transport system substrate-binding protein